VPGRRVASFERGEGAASYTFGVQGDGRQEPSHVSGSRRDDGYDDRRLGAGCSGGVRTDAATDLKRGRPCAVSEAKRPW